MSNRQPITDSLWFWFALFSGFGLAALLATGGKFGKRQAGVERRFQARQYVQSSGKVDDLILETRQGQSQSKDEPKDGGEETSKGPALPKYSTPKETLLRLGPLAGIVGAVCAGSLVLLVRERLLLKSVDRSEQTASDGVAP